MKNYDAGSIEKKWQKYWEEHKTYASTNETDKEKYYLLVEFPYPSGQGLHVGHPRPYTAMDVVARKRRLEGYNVLYPMGWDAFGLPTENYAIKNKIHPEIVTEQNVKRFKNQLKTIGFSFDWDREINTTDPEYFKWTQWIFIQMFKKGLAYKKEASINWCPSCKVGLANEEVVNGCCERCGTETTHKVKNQWMLKITEYADRLIDDLSEVDFIERVKSSQINWIGRSNGAEIDFAVKNTDESLKIFTTRPDTIFGSTYMVVAPEHPIIDRNSALIKNMDEVIEYRDFANKKSELERTQITKEKTGVRLDGISAVNPATGAEIPIWISDYVMMTYGTGAIMAVPAHDERDYEFAKKFDMPIIEVIAGGDISECAFTDTQTGTLVNSDFLNGLSVADAKEKIISWLEEKKLGVKKVNFKLRDWVFSRQRYWGEPIPMIHCEKCGWVPVPEENLPVRLPEVENYEPTDTGESPLALITDWVNTTCPCCGGPAHRETDTMPQWAGSSWYYLRYADPKCNTSLASKNAIDYWTPVNWYNGGMEHTTLHLLYSRFWHKFLYDIGVVPTVEPYKKRTSHGMILGSNGEKMSKSRGNVVNPDDIVSEFGADTLRTYEMFIGDFEKSVPWSEDGVKGCRRFLDRVWNLQEIVVADEKYSDSLEVEIHKAIKKVSYDYENLKYNTAIATLMSLLNSFAKAKIITSKDMSTFLTLLYPVAPHITEELWEVLELGGKLNAASWPEYDEAKTVEDVIELPVQINGKLRAKITLPRDMENDEVLANAKAMDELADEFAGKKIVKEIYVKGKIINFVIK